MSKHIFKWAVYVLLILFVAGCGGTTSPDDDGGSGGNGGGGGGGGNGDPGGGGTGIAVQLGSFNSSGDFVPGTIDTDKTTLKAGETATLSVALVDSNGNFATDPIDVSFTSPCASQGRAAIEPAIATTVDGKASATYTARGCAGADEITAGAAANGATLNASVTLQTQAAPPASILFQSAVPPQLGLKGTGGVLTEQSVVTFKLTNASGDPAAGKTVTFALSTEVGGISLSTRQDTTDAQGLVSTTVSSGTVPTSVRVMATTTTEAGQELTAVSNALAITTGLPDNNSVSLSAETLNIEGWGFDNVTTEITVLLADRFNNPVPDDTAVTFTTEGGAIEASCLTVAGQCSVTFRSQAPRPGDGRVTILATAIGEESFIDSNGDGLYNAGESFVDLPEAFLDKNESDTREAFEPFKDFSRDGVYTPADGQFNGLCEPGCTNNSTVHVRDTLVIVLSESALSVSVEPATIHLRTGGAAQYITVTVQGIATGQVAPSGTTIAAEATQGEIVGATSYTQTNTNSSVASGAGRFSFRLKPGKEPGNGAFIVTVTTPKGLISRGAADIVQTGAPAP